MNKEELIETIVRAVEHKLNEKQEESSAETPDERPRLLIVTRLNHSCHHCFRGDEAIAENYAVECSYDQAHDVDLTDIEEIFVRNMDNESLAKLTTGMIDTPYLKLISQAILKGRKVTVILDDLDVYTYRNTAPKAFLDMLNSKVDILRSWGIRIEKEGCAVKRLSCGKIECSEYLIEKKVLTETDVKRAYNDGHREIYIKKKTIVTDMAKEYAERNAVKISISEKESL